MGYFGGLGAARGWRKFYFCITPEEFRAVLESEPALLVVTNRRTDESDRYVDVIGFIDNYRVYAESVASDDTTGWRINGTMWVSVTHPRCSLHIRPVSDRPGEPLAVAEPQEPVIELRALSICHDGKTLYTNTLDPRDEQWFGMEMDFARVVFPASDGYAVGCDTSNTPNAVLFARLTAQVGAITCPCGIEPPSASTARRSAPAPRCGR